MLQSTGVCEGHGMDGSVPVSSAAQKNGEGSMPEKEEKQRIKSAPCQCPQAKEENTDKE